MSASSSLHIGGHDAGSWDRRTFLKGALSAAVLPTLPDPGDAPDVQTDTTSTSDLAFRSAREAARAIRDGGVSSEELTRHILERIDRFNPKLNAIVTLLREPALGRARAADSARSRGEWWGPLHGVPITLKESLEIAGVRTTAGAPSLADHVPDRDAVTVARLRAAGAVLLGHTNVPVMLDDFQSYNELYGTSNNPWDLSRTPGGSTGGGAAAVAAGLSFLSIGSDLGGSIRVPAHFCGIFGHRPTGGVVSHEGHIPPLPGTLTTLEEGLATLGPLCRSASDLGLALSIIGGPAGDRAKAYCWKMPPPRGASLRDYRIGFLLDDPLCPVSSDSRAVLVRAVEELEKAGARLVEGWPPEFDFRHGYHTWLHLVFAARPPRLTEAQRERLRIRAEQPDGTLEAVQAAAVTAPVARYFEARNERLCIRATWERWFHSFDGFLMPTTFVPAFPHLHGMEEDKWNRRVLETPEGKRRYGDLNVWTSVSGLTGLPATVAPVGLTREGLPVGVQILGPYLEDATPIDLAGRITDVVGGIRHPPGF